MTRTNLVCLSCMTTYGYIGDGPHPGSCPECGSRCVPPAGELIIRGNTTWRAPNGLATARVYAYDECGRPFEFELSAHNDRGTLTGVKIDGIEVPPALFQRYLRVPDSVHRTCASLGIASAGLARSAD
ncbi:hypothetical protein [Halalkalirubrum salinum]|uniref:hypothetical protein n=1 Tax=Halalkalirubrum salinum TaxID=2563889 RepID=UPI0010FB75D3|nr:hypothetical protein [Halalkalirubrum salinum]